MSATGLDKMVNLSASKAFCHASNLSASGARMLDHFIKPWWTQLARHGKKDLELEPLPVRRKINNQLKVIINNQIRKNYLKSICLYIMEPSPILGPSLKSIAPQQEYLLQGSILDSHQPTLLHRLRGLCDDAEHSPEPFRDYEAVYQIKNSNSGPGQGSPFVLFRVRHSLDKPESPPHIRYVGSAELGDRSRPTLVRACLDVAVSPNVRDFLTEMGFRLDHDFVAEGFFFHKGRMKVLVYKVKKLKQPGSFDPSHLEDVGGSHLVELSVVAPLGQEQVGEDMKNFADTLKPLVSLEKVDHRRLQ